MKKILRIVKESFFTLFFLKNPFVYFRERLGLFSDKVITLKLRNGIKYSINANTNGTGMLNEIWNIKIYDPLLKYIHNGATVVDIGANVGIFSIKAAKQALGVKVLSYEPAPHNFKLLNDNIALNRLANAVIPCNAAVCAKSGAANFFFRASDSGGGSLRRYDPSMDKMISVNCVTLGDIFSKYQIRHCDVLKIDCEGAEAEILMNAPLLLLRQISAMAIEWHHTINSLPRKEFESFLTAAGYQTSYNSQSHLIYAFR